MPPLFVPAAQYDVNWSGRVLVLAPGDIPTVDFYLSSRLLDVPAESVFRFDSRRFNPTAASLPDGTFVVIVRHAGKAWLDFLYRHRNRWSGVAYLMDDDIPAAWRCSDVPVDYGLWTTGRYLLARRGLKRVCDRIWMSTERLRERYAQVSSILVEPLPFAAARAAAPVTCRRWGYHGTRAHGRELRWLIPVVEAVQRLVPEAEFEVFGDHRVARLFCDIPRVTVLPPRSWRDYLFHCDVSNLAVGLAPMLPGRFNAVRSHTKAYDIARCGAVGVFSAREPYASALADAGAALVPDEQQAWVAEIVRLLEDDMLRLERYRQAADWMKRRFCKGSIAELIG